MGGANGDRGTSEGHVVAQSANVKVRIKGFNTTNEVELIRLATESHVLDHIGTSQQSGTAVTRRVRAVDLGETAGAVREIRFGRKSRVDALVGILEASDLKLLENIVGKGNHGCKWGLQGDEREADSAELQKVSRELGEN
jgi:hypothetical protein